MYSVFFFFIFIFCKKVSLGTGHPPVTELKEIDVFRPDSIWDTAKLAYGISAIGNLLVDQATLGCYRKNI